MPTKALVLGLRDVLHFVVTFAASFVVIWQAAGSPLNKAGLYSLAPAAATVLFRQLFPNAGRIQADVTKYVPPVPLPRPVPDGTTQSAA